MQETLFKLHSDYSPCGDQPKAIESLLEGLNDGLRSQVLKGVTGSGKTYTIANVINRVQRPTLVITHNKTLASQLYSEFKEFFPENRVEFFVSYYDYYQPEAYIPRSDTYIEKELQINDEIERLRNSATSSLCERRDVIVVASVSCIYGLGAPIDYFNISISLRIGDIIDRDELINRLVDIQYKRAGLDFMHSQFRVRGENIEIYPSGSYSEKCIRIQFFDNEIESIKEFSASSGIVDSTLQHVTIFPATQYVISANRKDEALEQINKDLFIRANYFRDNNKFIEQQRITERVQYDIEMIKELNYCTGIENYSRYFDGRNPGDTPYCLLDFFGDDFLTIVDESHMTLPQIRGMYNGDLSRKRNLVEYGFRLPSAFDNRPLRFEEFDEKVGQIIHLSATPGDYEKENSDNIVEQIIRPTGLVDPLVVIMPTKNQIDDLVVRINKSIKSNGRILITTLTKKMAENLSSYLRERNYKVTYMHSEISTLDRVEIISDLRAGELDILVGINLLREGLDIPEVKLVAILDADKEGFLRSHTSLIQTIGRAARNSESEVVLYADVITRSIQLALDETNDRRDKQIEYNKEHNITPKTIIKKNIKLERISKTDEKDENLTKKEIDREIDILTARMRAAAMKYDFELAQKYKNKIKLLKEMKKNE